eukprot:CAMPEP_0114981110 /NCGR_PEP_ID=MMETSP0216-20121206/5354_1 /TAXON_ID=223996 /ORGANISM="Protocruzia adherens, Strain Boccale" /LENGTH=426 /DNA_ID=CAMNT_0002342729 /DNA_START=52 /DNA_END=1332 /DNA_ORIENTATION=+
MNKYRLTGKKGEGTFSEVLKAQSIATSKSVAIKCMKNQFDSIEQVNNLREIQALRRLSPHEHVIKLLEVLYDEPTGRLALVFELMELNLYELIRGRRHYLEESRVKGYMYQLLKSLDHMHRNGIFHRDIKPENVLLLNEHLKLADFGSCRGIYSKPPYTEYISTRWYRAPECLLTDGYYNYKMDLWGVGCVMFEVLSLFPLFPGNNELDQVHKIHKIMGTPSQELLDRFQKHASHMDFNFAREEGTGLKKLMPHITAEGQDLIIRLLAYNPDDRLSARQALKHPYFRELRELEKPTQLNRHIFMKTDGSGYNPASHRSRTHYPEIPHKSQKKEILEHKVAGGLPDIRLGIVAEGLHNKSDDKMDTGELPTLANKSKAMRGKKLKAQGKLSSSNNSLTGLLQGSKLRKQKPFMKPYATTMNKPQYKY